MERVTRKVEENWRLCFRETQLKKVQGRSGIQHCEEGKHKEVWTSAQEILLQHGECGLVGMVLD